MNTKQMQKAVVRHYALMDSQYAPLRMAQLAPGVIAVEDKSGECDAMFDTTQWRWTQPEIWERGGESGGVGRANLGVLQGIGRFPAVRDIESMVGFARANLTAIGSHVWYAKPEIFDFRSVKTEGKKQSDGLPG